jgi:hypothetical protein
LRQQAVGLGGPTSHEPIYPRKTVINTCEPNFRVQLRAHDTSDIQKGRFIHDK